MHVCFTEYTFSLIEKVQKITLCSYLPEWLRNFWMSYSENKRETDVEVHMGIGTHNPLLNPVVILMTSFSLIYMISGINL